ncbi:multiple epidermal growth factor-like domains protein 10 isoform X1 [Dreissena polymorpha]|uniref:multiple epidermal growth factor-like domains protein 10 isoform X1 n=1 Tax=Dreissena polymorpha TaxID=45954 RepID=UPI002263BE16|nr:multiple epidermal growth factor-like domains protein 10 isoform X1 [Dreissena polymorpha]
MQELRYCGMIDMGFFQACDSGSFGMNCSFPCHCQEGIGCDHVSGNCSDKECSPEWTGHNCSTECMQGSFGKNCASLCHCKDNSVCDHINGHCPSNLCSKGWRFDNCSIAHTFPTVSDKDSKGIPISAFVAVVVFLAIAVGCNIVLATFYIKLRRKRQSGTENNTIVTSPSSLRSDEYDTISPRLQETNDYEGLQMETRTYYND